MQSTHINYVYIKYAHLHKDRCIHAQVNLNLHMIFLKNLESTGTKDFKEFDLEVNSKGRYIM